MLRDLILILGAAVAACAGLVFVVAAAGKLRHRDVFPGVVANYRLLPEMAVAPVALLLPWIELATGIALLAGEHRIAPAIAAVLLALFAVAMAINIGRGRGHIDCGCGGDTLRQQLRPALVIRNLVLATPLATVPVIGGELIATDRAVALGAGAAMYLLYLLLNVLLTLPGLRPQPA